MKSGPTLNAWTARPRRRNASSKPSVTVVLPTPLDTPATTSAGTCRVRIARSSVEPTGDAGRLERRHLGEHRHRGPGQRDGEGRPRALAEPHPKIEVRLEPEIDERAAMPGLGRAVGRDQDLARRRGDADGGEGRGGGDEAVHDDGDVMGGPGEDHAGETSDLEAPELGQHVEGIAGVRTVRRERALDGRDFSPPPGVVDSGAAPG